MAISAITLIEIVMLFARGALRIRLSMDEVFSELEDNPMIRILPLTLDIAKEFSAIGQNLRDPADRMIVAPPAFTDYGY